MMKATIIALILGCILTCVISAQATTQAFVITLNPENTMIREPANGMVLRSWILLTSG